MANTKGIETLTFGFNKIFFLLFNTFVVGRRSFTITCFWFYF